MVLRTQFPISGIGEGAGLPFLTILAMNLRQEISMGLEADGCTSFAWKTDSVSLLAQNWDVSSHQPSSPSLVLTEQNPVGRSPAAKPHPSQHQKNFQAIDKHDHRSRNNRQDRPQLIRRRCLHQRHPCPRRRLHPSSSPPRDPRRSRLNI